MKTETAKPLSWKPIRRGAIYCAPACGSGCTHAAYLKAHKDAADTIKRLKTKGWKVRVHENMGWHWCLVNTVCGISLHRSQYPKRWRLFWTMISTETGSSSGDSGINYSDSFADPNKAVSQQIKRAMPYFKHQANAFENLKRFAGKP